MRFIEFWSVYGTRYIVRIDSIIGFTCNDADKEYQVILQFSKVSVSEDAFSNLLNFVHDYQMTEVKE